jgi:hypothetical protein
VRCARIDLEASARWSGASAAIRKLEVADVLAVQREHVEGDELKRPTRRGRRRSAVRSSASRSPSARIVGVQVE